MLKNETEKKIQYKKNDSGQPELTQLGSWN